MIFVDAETRELFEDAIRNLATVDERNPQQVREIFEKILLAEHLKGTFKGVNGNK